MQLTFQGSVFCLSFVKGEGGIRERLYDMSEMRMLFRGHQRGWVPVGADRKGKERVKEL